MKIKSLLATLLICASALLPAEVKVMQGLSGLAFDANTSGKAAAWQKLYVTAIVYPRLPYSIRACDILTLQKQKYPTKVECFVIIPETLDNVKKFAQENPNFDLTACADENFVESSKLLGKNFQQTAIFNHSGKLLWSGEAIDLDMMLRIITSGRYSEREEARISALIAALQASLRSGNPKMIIQSADMILALRDEQPSAVSAKAYALEMSRDFAALEKFFRDRIKKYPQEPGNYFMLIEASFRNPAMQRTAPAIAMEYFRKFQNNTANINAICWSLLNNMPYSAEAFAAAAAGEKLLIKSPQANQSRVLMTRSLIAYRRCDLKSALAFAGQALKQARTAEEKSIISQMIKYYKSVK